jgi:K+/H+ antiporter YhaU regulatory subunit KhtT
MTGVKVQAERLPGIGWRYSLPANRERELSIVVEDRGPRHLVLIDPSTDESLTTIRLTDADATVVAALLTGARPDIRYSEDDVPRRRGRAATG